MKTFLILAFFFACLNAFGQGEAPTFLQGQGTTSKSVSGVVQVPNVQATKIDGFKSLIETGNMNLLANPGFEHSTYSTSWTTSGTGTFSAETSSLIAGKKAMKVVTSAQTFTITQDSTLYAAQLAGMQGLVKVFGSNTAAGVSICARAAGTTSTTDCVTMATDGVWKEYVIPVVFSATSNGISIAAGSTTGTTILEEAKVQLSGEFPEVSQAQIAGSSIWAAGTCTQTRASTTLGAMTGVAGCPGPTVEIQNIGTWATTDADMIKQTITNLPPGQYVASFQFTAGNSASTNAFFTIFDGTTSCKTSNQIPGANTTYISVRCPFAYTTSGTRVFEIYASSSASTLTVSNESGTGATRETRFTLEYYPPETKIYSQKCTNNPAQCENVFSLKSTNAGVVSDENLDFLNGNFTVSPTGTFTGTFNTGIFTDGPSCVANTSGSGYAIADIDTTSTTVTVKLIARNDASTPTNQAFNLICQKTPPDYKSEAVITGTFAEMSKYPGISKPKTCVYYFGGASATLASPTVCSTGTCVEVYDSCVAATPPAFSSTGTYTGLTFANRTWAASTPVICQCRTNGAAGVASLCTVYAGSGSAAWSSDSNGAVAINVQSQEADSAPLNLNSYAQIVCTGAAP